MGTVAAKAAKEVRVIPEPKSHLLAQGPVTTLILLGTSTGGPAALTTVFEALPLLPGTACCIVQHMPTGFTANLAKRLDQVSAWNCCEASDGMLLQSGAAYVAPGGQQMQVTVHHSQPKLAVASTGPVNGHEPSVDVLFLSAAQHWRSNLIGVLMTGMGKDGAQGLLSIRSRGGYTLAQDEDSCVVYGMPKAAAQLGAAAEIVRLSSISKAVVQAWQHQTQLRPG